jgi:DNA-binding LacI/PurR family transcriptional regulator
MNDEPLVTTGRMPAYVRIARTLREQIVGGAYGPNDFLPPERQLAGLMGSSRETVRLAIDALRQEGLVAPEQGRGTRVIGVQAPDESVIAGTHLNLGALVIYGMLQEGSAAICHGCQSVMRAADFHLVVCLTGFETTIRAINEASQLRSLIDKGVRGIIIYAEPTDQNRSLLQEALEKGIKVVQIDRYLPELACDFVGVDNERAASELAEHLLSIGHRRIAFLSHTPEPSTCRDRLNGFSNVLRAAGAFDPQLVAHCSDDWRSNRGGIICALDRWFGLPDPPTVIAAVNDDLALLLIPLLAEQRLRIPDDIAVTGFDNQNATKLLSPPLTTVEQPFIEIGETAARLLLDRLAGRYSGAPQRITMPTRLIVRESCGARGRRTPALHV